jgi:uncharacterized tellurite resistance protein B-like protein
VVDRLSEKLRGIYGAVAGKRVVPSVPPGRTAKLAGDEARVAAPRPGAPSAFSFFIHYRSDEGEHSFRRIVCRRVDLWPSPCIGAYCLERKAFRRFRLDRIEEAVALETGEVLDVGALIDDLRRRGLPVSDPRLARTLKVLSFLMRCDSEDHPLERTAIENAVTSFALRFDGDDDMVREGVSLAGSLAPDARDFTRALGWVARSGGRDVARFLLSHAAAVIDADGRHTEEEVRYGAEVGDLLKRVAVS